MPIEPFAFVHVALTPDIVGSMADIKYAMSRREQWAT